MHRELPPVNINTAGTFGIGPQPVVTDIQNGSVPVRYIQNPDAFVPVQDIQLQNQTSNHPSAFTIAPESIEAQRISGDLGLSLESRVNALSGATEQYAHIGRVHGGSISPYHYQVKLTEELEQTSNLMALTNNWDSIVEGKLRELGVLQEGEKYDPNKHKLSAIMSQNPQLQGELQKLAGQVGLSLEEFISLDNDPNKREDLRTKATAKFAQITNFQLPFAQEIAKSFADKLNWLVGGSNTNLASSISV